MVKPWFPDLLDGSEVRDHSQAWQIRARATVLEIGLRAKREAVSLLCLTSLNPCAIRAVSAHLARTGIQSWNPKRQQSKPPEAPGAPSYSTCSSRNWAKDWALEILTEVAVNKAAKSAGRCDGKVPSCDAEFAVVTRGVAPGAWRGSWLKGIGKEGASWLLVA